MLISNRNSKQYNDHLPPDLITPNYNLTSLLGPNIPSELTKVNCMAEQSLGTNSFHELGSASLEDKTIEGNSISPRPDNKPM